MKVCYSLATTDLYGGTRSMLDLVDCCLLNNIEPIVILTKKHNKLEKILKEKNVKYKIIFHGTDAVSNNKLKNLSKIIINKIAQKRIYRFIKKSKIDIIHNNSVISLVGMKAAYMANIPYICHIRELIEKDLGLKLLNYKELHNCILRSYCTICISKFVENNFNTILLPEKNYTFYDGLNIKNYNTPQRNFGKFKNNLLFVGRFCSGKGQLDALKAINILVNNFNMKNIKITFIGNIGDIQYYKQLEKIRKDNNLEKNVFFEKFSVDLKDIRQKSDIALVCSSNEAMGRVTPEAMLSHQLVIGANAGCTKDIITDGDNGYLYQLNNPRDLAEKIKYAIENESKSNSIMKKGYDYAIKHFDNNTQNQKVIDIYKKIIDY